MPPCSNPTKWRTGVGAQFKMFILKPTAVFSGQIDQTSFPEIVTFLDIDNTSGSHTAVRNGMTILFGTAPGLDDLGRNRIGGATADLIQIGAASRGSLDGELIPVNNAYFTVLGQDFRIWAKIPRITDDGTQYKDYSTGFATNFDRMPKANSGGWYANDPDPDTGLITVFFSGLSSYDQADSSLTHDWDFGDGTPSSSADPLPGDVTFPEGFRMVEHLVTSLATGLSHIEYIPVYNPGLTPENDPQYITNFMITEHTMRPEGQTMNVLVDSSIDMSEFPDGTLCMIWSTEYWRDGSSGSLNTSMGVEGREHMVFCGWHYTDPVVLQAYDKGLRTDTTLNLVDAAGKLATLPGFSQIVERIVPPTSWYQMNKLTVNREYIDYLLRWHSTALDIVDFHPYLAQDYSVSTLASEGSNLYDQADHRCRAMAYRLTCDREGVLWMRPDPQLLATQDQADEVPASGLPVRTDDVQIEIDEDVWTSVRYTHQRPPKNHWLRGYAIVVSSYGVDTVSAIEAREVVAPGIVPGQGSAQTEQDEQVIINTDELRYRMGNMYMSRLNAVNGIFEVRLTPTNNAGIEPAYMEWVTLTVSDDTAGTRGQTFDNVKFLPQQVNISYNHKEGTRQFTVTIEQESYGQPAVEVVQQQNSLPIADTPVIGAIPPVTVLGGEETLLLDEGIAKIALFDTNGYAYITTTFNMTAPVWARTDLGIDGTPIEFVVDAFSPRYLNVNTEVNGWLVTSTDIYRVTNIFGAIAATSQFTFADPTSYRSMDFSFGEEGFGVVSSYYEGVGVTATWTSDGETWDEVSVSGDYNTTTGILLVPGCYVSPRTAGLVYITAPTATGAGDTFTSSGFYSTDYGENWSAMTNPDLDPENWLAGSVHVPYDSGVESTVYYGAEESSASIPSGGGYDWQITFNAANGWTGWVANGGSHFGSCGTLGGGQWTSQAACATLTQAVGIELGFGGLFTLGEINVEWDSPSNINSGIREIQRYDGSSYSNAHNLNSGSGSHSETYSFTESLSTPWNKVVVIISDDGADNGPSHITQVILRGTNPVPDFTGLSIIRKIKKSVGAVITDVSPVVSSEEYGLINQRAIHSCPIDDTVLAAIAQGYDTGKFSLFTSTNSAGAWTTRITPATNIKYRRLAIAGDNSEIIYLYGEDGTIAYTSNQGSAIASKAGNISGMSGPTPGDFVGLCGG